MNEKKQYKLNDLNEKITNLVKESINKFQINLENEITIENPNSLKKTIIAGIFSSTFSSITALGGIYVIVQGSIETLTVGTEVFVSQTGIGIVLGTAAGLSSTGIGVGIGIAVGIGAVFLYKYLTKYKKYQAILKKVKAQIYDKFNDEFSKFDDNINTEQEALINKLGTEVELKKINIDNR